MPILLSSILCSPSSVTKSPIRHGSLALGKRNEWLLVHAAASYIERSWPLSLSKDAVPIRTFIQHLLSHSRSSFSVLRIALIYVLRLNKHIPTLLKTFLKEKSVASANPLKACSAMLQSKAPEWLCGRRMFLAALITASKFLNDTNYSNKAWAKITGLSVSEINVLERSFLQVLDYNIYVDAKTFDAFSAEFSRKVKSLASSLISSSATAPASDSSVTGLPAAAHSGLHGSKRHRESGSPAGYASHIPHDSVVPSQSPTFDPSSPASVASLASPASVSPYSAQAISHLGQSPLAPYTFAGTPAFASTPSIVGSSKPFGAVPSSICTLSDPVPKSILPTIQNICSFDHLTPSSAPSIDIPAAHALAFVAPSIMNSFQDLPMPVAKRVRCC
ncbi:cyclin-domain-containing protein [Polychytrium aggregatum]|uniref:cyclin-domain-containing protein n=1 Tax=Polychytrium aggregatum TaxID=110093 RepID=UPI0022FEAD77|nr:cyclin-domain-containing protein [Polychytrium aggregatum]KAI9199635.1 cyclin-domain-containing protein [Polychytrium aggregatum]